MFISEGWWEPGEKGLSKLRRRGGRAQRQPQAAFPVPFFQLLLALTLYLPFTFGRRDMDLRTWPLGTQPHVSALSIFLDRAI